MAPIAVAVVFVAALIGLAIYIPEAAGKSLFIWVGTVPTLLFHLGMFLFWATFALIVWWIAERSLVSETRDRSQETVYRLLLVASSFFVFLLGFVVSQEWNNVNEVRRDVSTGAAAIDTARYKAEALPPSERAKVQDALSALSRSIACQDLPAIRETGWGTQQTVTALRNAFLAVSGLPPSVRQESIFEDLLDEVGHVSESRRLILAGASSGLPGVVRIVIFIVAGLLITLFIIQSTKSRRAHKAMIVGLVLLVSVGTGMVISLARPFGGSATVEVDFDQASRQGKSDCSGSGT